ncbi:TonB-dependent receptor [Marinilabilia rubra]|uniref:TonB-dependent receptor n=1 Tax=Marinilabilia rubra TaxID=2162893 RepID=A0A2U2B551_9BACT|nr:TonB-dependent receptor [Marinilabilia rubra]PWD98185.1 TonB-dependent receptor [Marinilabilia rubra]
MMLRFLLIVFLSINILSGSTQSIEGTVYEQNTKVLPGANIHWEGTSTGTVTDKNGHFSLPKTNETHTLIVSFTGLQSDTIHVLDNQNNLKITLDKNQELDEVTITGRASGAHISRTEPVTTVKITEEELCRAACCSLSESFETNASVDVSYSDAATGAKQIKLLGLSGKYLQMLTETMPNFRGLGATFGFEYVPGTWMESIKISKGAATVVNGYEGLTGQINVEYKKPTHEDKLFLNGFANSKGRYETNANTRIHLGNHWKTAILAHASAIAVENDENNDGFLDDPMTQKYSLMNRWEYQNPVALNLQLGLKVVQEERTGGQKRFDRNLPHSSQAAYGIIIDTKRVESFLKAARYFADDESTNLSMVNNISYHEQESLFGNRVYNAKQTHFRSTLMFQSQLMQNTRHSYTTGLTYKMDMLTENYSGNNIIVKNPGMEEHVKGLFFQYTWNIPETFTLIAGMRADHSNLFDFFFTPRLHLKFEIDESTTVRGSAGAGYRTPKVLAENNSLLASSRSFVVDETIEQEKGWNYGVNVAKYFYPGDKEVAFNVEFYRTDFQNRLVIDFDKSARELHFYNLKGRSYANTFQASLSSEILKGLDVLLAYRLNDTRITTNNDLRKKALQSRNKGLANISYASSRGKWQIDFTSQFNGSGRLPSTAENPIELQRNIEFDSYTILNSQLTHNLKNWSFYGGIENLTDFVQKNPIIDAESPFSDYFDSSMVWGPIMGRRFYLGFRFSI